MEGEGIVGSRTSNRRSEDSGRLDVGVKVRRPVGIVIITATPFILRTQANSRGRAAYRLDTI